MFPYYGSKLKIVKHYPKPIYDTIIEPAAGAAWYSVLHRDKQVILNEKNKVIYGIWHWLINEANVNDILSLTDFYKGQDISGLDIHPSHKNLIGFCINRGSVSPKNIVTNWSCQVKSTPTWASTVSFNLKRIAAILPDIKHWVVTNTDYTEVPRLNATYFIDLPYQFGGEHYVENKIDFTESALFSKSLNGQIIVCENSKANWLPFQPLINLQGQKHKTKEVIYYSFNP